MPQSKNTCPWPCSRVDKHTRSRPIGIPNSASRIDRRELSRGHPLQNNVCMVKKGSHMYFDFFVFIFVFILFIFIFFLLPGRRGLFCPAPARLSAPALRSPCLDIWGCLYERNRPCPFLGALKLCNGREFRNSMVFSTNVSYLWDFKALFFLLGLQNICCRPATF